MYLDEKILSQFKRNLSGDNLRLLRGRFIGSFDSSDVTVIMLSLVHTFQQMRVPLIRVALYGTPVKTLGQVDVINKKLVRELWVSL